MVPCESKIQAMEETGKSLLKTLLIRPAMYYRRRLSKDPQEYSSFFQVKNEDEHLLESQYKLEIVQDCSDKEEEYIERYNWGSNRSIPPNHVHKDPNFQMYKQSGVTWKPVS